MAAAYCILLNALQLVVNSVEFDNMTLSTINYWSEARRAIISLSQVSPPCYHK